MTICTYCGCDIGPHEAWYDDGSRHRDTFKCIAALKRRVAELQAELEYIKDHPSIEDMDD